MKSLLVIISAALLFLACKKDSTPAGEKAEIYLLNSYRFIPLKCQVDASTAVLEITPIITNEDILSYSKTKHEIKLSGLVYEKLKKLSDQTPFAVTIDKKVLYYGVLKPGYSSSSCNHSITMDYVLPGNKVGFHLGYPGDMAAGTIDDIRNHPLWLNTLNNQRKLTP